MSQSSPSLAVPTKEQIEWADAEIGVIIHFDLQVFEPEYDFRRDWGYTPDLKVFNPSSLDTDQWLESAQAAGATYAILVAKHCSGFSLWPTKAHDYHVGNTPWKNGQGDVVADFIASCKKYNIKPGLYCSASFNGYLLVDNPGKVLIDDPAFLEKYNNNLEMQSGKASIWASEDKQQQYITVVETQLTELWSHYGKLFEIWFDGGVLPPEEGGPNIVPIMKRLQPDSVVFGGPPDWPSLVRFIGNERAEPSEPFWNSTSDLRGFGGAEEVVGLDGDPDGATWAPGEADMPNRNQNKALQAGWFWKKGEDEYLYSVDHLVERYFSSVGRSCNLLLGMVIDNRGQVPEADQRQFSEFGTKLASIFSNRCEGLIENDEIIQFSSSTTINIVELKEDISYGERVRRYVLEAHVDGSWINISCGNGIGHKKLDRFEEVNTTAIRVRILENRGNVKLLPLKAWYANPSHFSVPLDLAKRHLPSIFRDAKGYVHIQCDNPNLHIKYSCGNEVLDDNAQDYVSPLYMPEGGQVQAYTYLNHLSHSDVATAVFGVDRSAWKIHSVSFNSSFTNDGHAGVEHLLNDDPHYYWHTYHANSATSSVPQHVVFDMNTPQSITAFTVMFRGKGGAPSEGSFSISHDGSTWTLATEAQFNSPDPGSEMQIVKLKKPVHGRFLRFDVSQTLDNHDYVAVAGIGMIR